ncbi:hypothetical protein [Micromonospora sp. RTP1Z1]|uniref:hypothetical protein n=1 Tax=Micromonospora sp. RTP1Z1 TaxID=2994043 RepID=UPI0029C85AA8|nr:hypothetical protein [Micromonospora sp. RTP1Z1]
MRGPADRRGAGGPERGPRLGWSGGDEAVEWPIRVRLDHPLAGRQVIDGHTDALIPER